MYKNKKNKRRKFVVLGLIILVIILLFFSVLLDRKVGFIEKVLKEPLTFINKSSMYFFNQSKDKNSNESYLIEKNINSSLVKEIEELKDLLKLNKTLTEYEPINSTVLSRNRSYWFNTIMIDKGEKDGLKEDMAVITKDGLIGKISKVYHSSSEVKLITSDDINFKVSVSINTNGVDNYAILNGYSKKNNLIKATGIDKTTKINKGDIVVTSGLGELFPSGIYIGVVEKIEDDKYNLSKNIFIKTYQNFNSIHYVTVLKVK